MLPARPSTCGLFAILGSDRVSSTITVSWRPIVWMQRESAAAVLTGSMPEVVASL